MARRYTRKMPPVTKVSRPCMAVKMGWSTVQYLVRVRVRVRVRVSVRDRVRVRVRDQAGREIRDQAGREIRDPAGREVEQYHCVLSQAR